MPSPSGAQQNTAPLVRRFQAYLAAHLDVSAGEDLCRALLACGLVDEARGLEAYEKLGSGATFILEAPPWNGLRGSASALPPAHPSPGEVWLDVVELTPMVLVNGPTRGARPRAHWVAARPVQVWQYRAFLALVKWRLRQQFFMDAPDLLAPRRVEQQHGLAPVTCLYMEEAVAYAHWFRKGLCGRAALKAAQASLRPTQFAAVLPPALRLFEDVEAGPSEAVRAVFGRDTLTDYPDKRPEDMLVREWEALDDVGCATHVPQWRGLTDTRVPKIAYEFVELLNLAPRPVQGGAGMNGAGGGRAAPGQPA